MMDVQEQSDDTVSNESDTNDKDVSMAKERQLFEAFELALKMAEQNNKFENANKKERPAKNSRRRRRSGEISTVPAREYDQESNGGDGVKEEEKAEEKTTTDDGRDCCNLLKSFTGCIVIIIVVFSLLAYIIAIESRRSSKH